MKKINTALISIMATLTVLTFTSFANASSIPETNHVETLKLVHDHCYSLSLKPDLQSEMSQVLLNATGVIPEKVEVEGAIYMMCVMQNYEHLSNQLVQSLAARGESL